MSNKRIFYAIQAAAIGTQGTTAFTANQSVYGLQSLGISTKFNLEQVFEIGQIEIYENVEALPAIEVTMDKCLDGRPLIYHMATVGATDGSLQGRANIRCSIAASIYSDGQNAASGTPVALCYCSGTYANSLNYSFQVEGEFKESVTFVGNDKIWILPGSGGASYTSGFTTNTDAPANYPPIGVARRQHFIFGNTPGIGGTGQSINPTILPIDIDGIDPATGYNLIGSDGNYGAHVQSIRVSCNLGRDELHELGRKGPYFRFVNFPVEVRTDIEAISVRGDMVGATEAGVLGNGNNLSYRPIFIACQEGTTINLGNRNLLSNVSYGGGNAGSRGGNAMQTYSFITFNDMVVKHPSDPSVALAG